jgi:predicted Holliday junction resolvase-like endonuclease
VTVKTNPSDLMFRGFVLQLNINIINVLTLINMRCIISINKYSRRKYIMNNEKTINEMYEQIKRCDQRIANDKDMREELFKRIDEMRNENIDQVAI